MKFEIEVDEATGFKHLKHEGNLVIITSYTSRILDIVDDIIEHKGKATLIPYPVEDKNEKR